MKTMKPNFHTLFCLNKKQVIHSFHSIFKGILMSFIPFMVFFWSNESNFVSIDLYYFYNSIIFVGLFYFIFSIIGWVIFGIPTHCIAIKFFNGSNWCYLGGFILFSAMIIVTSGGINTLWFYSGVAGLQIALFLWCFKRRSK
jgi:hypothetical protein